MGIDGKPGSANLRIMIQFEGGRRESNILLTHNGGINKGAL
jgi:hypothetical protein